MLLVAFEETKRFLKIMKEARGMPVSLENLPRGGYTILGIEEDGKVLYVAERAVTGIKLRVWVHGTFPKLPDTLIGEYFWWDKDEKENLIEQFRLEGTQV